MPGSVVRAKSFPPDEPRPTDPLVLRQVHGNHLPQSVPQEAPPPPDERDEQRILEAHAAGRREGEVAGYNRATAEHQAAVERLAQSIHELAGLRARLRREAEGDVVQLALAIARRVLRREMTLDPDALQGLAIAALEKLQGQNISRVTVHPSQAGLLTACLQKAGGARVEVVADASYAPGSVVFETEHGNLDASIDTQLEEIARGLADCLRSPLQGGGAATPASSTPSRGWHKG
jgi:flagellar assembly protein FliH